MIEFIAEHINTVSTLISALAALLTAVANSSCYIFLVESNKAISRRDKKDG